MEELKKTLLPCPFCGGKCSVNYVNDTWTEYGCNTCEIYLESVKAWNTRAKEVIMSEPLKLSKVLGLKPLIPSEGFSQDWEDGYELALYRLDQRSPDVEELARIIYEQQYNRNININSRCPDWKKEAPYVKERFVLLAQEIINKMNVWIVKESSGQCNHEFMQQYDFSKFSNAGNSLKCVKCGLIKKG